MTHPGPPPDGPSETTSRPYPRSSWRRNVQSPRPRPVPRRGNRHAISTPDPVSRGVCARTRVPCPLSASGTTDRPGGRRIRGPADPPRHATRRFRCRDELLELLHVRLDPMTENTQLVRDVLHDSFRVCSIRAVTRVFDSAKRWNVIPPACVGPAVEVHATRSSDARSVMVASNSRTRPATSITQWVWVASALTVTGRVQGRRPRRARGFDPPLAGCGRSGSGSVSAKAVSHPVISYRSIGRGRAARW